MDQDVAGMGGINYPSVAWISHAPDSQPAAARRLWGRTIFMGETVAHI